MVLRHVITLDPTHKQAKAMKRACGVSRFTYNWGLAEWNRQYIAGEKPTAYKLKKQFNAIKREQFPWIMESPRDANSQPFADLGRAFINYFKSLKGEYRGTPKRHPQFHCKNKHRESFYVANDKFSLQTRGKRGIVRLPVIGYVRMMETLRWRGKILSGCVYQRANKWFLSISVDIPAVDRRESNALERHPVVGVDLGLKTAVVPSSGLPIDAPKPLRQNLKRLRKANRRLHRRQKNGQNRYKARLAVARLHFHIACIRKDFWNKITTDLCRKNQTIVIENLTMSFMARNRCLARAASDVALGMFRPMLTYKAKLHGCDLIIADRFFPSTQRCSRCGIPKKGEDKLDLENRVFFCNACGLTIDRDTNAAKNLEQYPRLEGNWWRVPPTSTEILPLSDIQCRASEIVEVETNPCERALVHTL